ncbi:beta-glucosidase [Deinococcus irradiatisoli]|uniref:Beta-glucosidase n=1 Tax=Deinococcus irradiatisoli TaxID=2202254 RepID=A0A2Z3JC93_9DEIO|nr:GH1 family beta-glucosidase [Deinococcus irradiatisoli]AWN22787.1 beta-glucosidase [Deinococcus irradiatisoli]
MTTLPSPAQRADILTRADFPAHFIFGVATSAYQIEGAVHEGGRGESIWDTFCREPGRIKDHTSGEVACDHYHCLESDLDLIKSLGVDAYRFSVAWPRIQPSGTGEANEAGLAFYERLVDGLTQRGIEPHLTLYHWDLPQALQDVGGWTNRQTAFHFAEYARIVTERLGNKVRSIATLNEPWCSSILSYQIGEHAPGWHNTGAALSAAHHLMLGHGLAMREMRRLNPSATLGIVLNLGPAYPATPADEPAARIADGTFNRWFLDPIFRGEYPQDIWAHYGAYAPETEPGDLEIIRAPLDFLGVNYYTRSYVAKGGDKPSGAEYTDMGWEVYPDGLRDLLVRLESDYTLPPIYITENGAAYPDVLGQDEAVHDAERVAYFDGHLRAVLAASRAGVDVRGYFAWSLMDNFEWAFGYTKRFGLVYVDYATQQRVLKDSAKWYQALATS